MPQSRFVLMLALLASFLMLEMPAMARGVPESFADLTEKLSPSVVNISTVQTVKRRTNGLRDRLPFGQEFFRFRDNEKDDEDEGIQTQSLGSGFIIDPSGLVVTNNHVIQQADEITVILADEREFVATVIGQDRASDLALLKIEADSPLPAVPFGDSDSERVGNWVMAIGNPFGLGGTVTAGIISARGRGEAGMGLREIDFIQTDASINKGNSGGPLFNMAGEVIGVNTAIFSPSGGSVGIGFSIPSNDVKLIITELEEKGRVRRGYLGVNIQTYSKELAEAEGVDNYGGVKITRVLEDGPALEAGIEVGDVIKSWQGTPVDDSRELQRAVARTRVGDTAEVTVLRAGELITLTVTVAELVLDGDDDDDTNAETTPEPKPDERLQVEGMDLYSMNDALKRRFRLDEDATGVLIVNIKRVSAAFRAGLRRGMIIKTVNNQAVETPQDVVAIIDAAKSAKRKSVLLFISTGNNSNFVPLPISVED